MLQVFLTGLPTVLIISENPQAKYIVMTTMVFVVTMSLLLLTFIPKFVLTVKEKSLSGNGDNSESVRQSRNSGMGRSTSRDDGQQEDERSRSPTKEPARLEPEVSLPFISDISMSLPPISEYEMDGGNPHFDATEMSFSGSADTNPRRPVRTISTAEEPTTMSHSEESVSSHNAKFPQRMQSEVEVVEEVPPDAPRSPPVTLVREPSKRTANQFSNAPLPRRAPSVVEV